MKQVTVIGSGNAFHTDARAHACYLLENSTGEMMLLDMGATALYRLQQEKTDLNAIGTFLITHFHGDHFGGLPFLLLEMDLIRKRKPELIIAGPVGVARACQQLIDICYPDFDFRFPIHYQEIPDKGTALHGFQIQPVPMEHKPESVGYRITGSRGNSFAFSGDARMNSNLLDLVRDVDVAVIELTMEAQFDPPVKHIALDEVRRMRSKLRPRRLIFSHIYDDLARKASAEGLGEAAYDGMVIRFD
ncbi:MAG: MBL fold metallo-hydrolase [Leptospiraceae bacterium]|nr:MBL fold metallo-hydrolase [Leptospiraceae bacterium]MCB1316858.1 MBL fold metallo-hydrolase [Leptospiraceae bacterium]